MASYSEIIVQSAIIIVHYGNIEVTNRCISSFYFVDSTPDIILIDNDPKNRYPIHPDIDIIHMPQAKNIGFAAGVNLGLKHAMQLNKKVVLLLNNDVEMPLKSILRLLGTACSCPCLAGGIEFAMDKKKKRTSEIIFAGGDVVWQETAIRIKKRPLHSKKRYPTQFVRGSCMAISLSLVQHIGFLEEKYWAYAEDVDFCLKASKAKYQLFIDPEVSLWHRVSEGFNPYRRNYLMARNYVLLLNSHARGLYFIKGMALGLSAALLSLFRPSRSGKFKGFMDGLLSIAKKFQA